MNSSDDDDYWNDSRFDNSSKHGFFDGPSTNLFSEDASASYLTSELESEYNAELLTIQTKNPPNDARGGGDQATNSKSGAFPGQEVKVASNERIAVVGKEASNVVSMSTIRQNHQTPFAPPLEKSRIVAPKSLAADYTFSVRKAVKEKPSDQSALELERCERLVQQFVRSSIAMAQSPKVTFSTDEVITKLSSGGKKSEEVVLEVFRSEKHKKQLLEKACASNNGACITKVAMFLFRTLNETVFRRLIVPQPLALNHLIAYFKSMNDFSNLERLFKLLDRHTDIFYLLLRKANKEHMPETKLWALQTISHRISSADVEPRLRIIGVSTHDLEMLTEQIKLTEAQIKLAQVNEAALKKKTNLVLSAHPLRTPITKHSLLSTVHHCEFYHPHECTLLTSSNPMGHNVHNASSMPSKEIAVDSAFYKTAFKMTDKEFQWPFVTANCKLRQWAKIERLMIHRGFFGSTSALMGGNKMQCAIGFGNLAHILSENDAPSDIIAKYLMCIKDQHVRLQQAGVLDCKLAFVLTFIERRDRHSLESFRSKLVPGSKEMHELNKALDDRSIKWKRS